MRLELIYFKNLLDICIIDFFNEFNDDFVNIGGYYILGKAIGKDQIKKFFKTSLAHALLKYAKPWNVLDPSYCIVIGSCMPNDNILLDFKKDQSYFPSKLQKLLNSDIKMKYVLNEDDIKIDIILFNEIFNDVFNDFFSDKNEVVKLLGKNFTNVVFVQHKCLDCYTMFKTIKFLYGKANCTNIWKSQIQSENAQKKTPLVSLNELICKYINNKTELNKSKKFKEKVYEVRDFIDNALNFVRS